MSKKVSFAAKPRNSKSEVAADEWVNSGERNLNFETLDQPTTEKSETTRFTIDIPVELHARIKSQCAMRRVKMRDEIQALLEKHFSL